MNIDPQLREELKQQKLKELQARYFELEMNKVALEAAGNTEEAAKYKEVLENVKKAYEAVEAI